MSDGLENFDFKEVAKDYLKENNYSKESLEKVSRFYDILSCKIKYEKLKSENVEKSNLQLSNSKTEKNNSKNRQEEIKNKQKEILQRVTKISEAISENKKDNTESDEIDSFIKRIFYFDSKGEAKENLDNNGKAIKSSEDITVSSSVTSGKGNQALYDEHIEILDERIKVIKEFSKGIGKNEKIIHGKDDIVAINNLVGMNQIIGGGSVNDKIKKIIKPSGIKSLDKGVSLFKYNKEKSIAESLKESLSLKESIPSKTKPLRRETPTASPIRPVFQDMTDTSQQSLNPGNVIPSNIYDHSLEDDLQIQPAININQNLQKVSSEKVENQPKSTVQPLEKPLYPDVLEKEKNISPIQSSPSVPEITSTQTISTPPIIQQSEEMISSISIKPSEKIVTSASMTSDPSIQDSLIKAPTQYSSVDVQSIDGSTPSVNPEVIPITTNKKSIENSKQQQPTVQPIKQPINESNKQPSRKIPVITQPIINNADNKTSNDGKYNYNDEEIKNFKNKLEQEKRKSEDQNIDGNKRLIATIASVYYDTNLAFAQNNNISEAEARVNDYIRNYNNNIIKPVHEAVTNGNIDTLDRTQLLFLREQAEKHENAEILEKLDKKLEKTEFTEEEKKNQFIISKMLNGEIRDINNIEDKYKETFEKNVKEFFKKEIEETKLKNQEKEAVKIIFNENVTKGSVEIKEKIKGNSEKVKDYNLDEEKIKKIEEKYKKLFAKTIQEQEKLTNKTEIKEEDVLLNSQKNNSSQLSSKEEGKNIEPITPSQNNQEELYEQQPEQPEQQEGSLETNQKEQQKTAVAMEKQQPTNIIITGLKREEIKKNIVAGSEQTNQEQKDRVTARTR